VAWQGKDKDGPDTKSYLTPDFSTTQQAAVAAPFIVVLA